MEPDATARSSFRDAWVGARGGLQPLHDYRLSQVNGANAVFALECNGVALQKTIGVRGDCIGIGYRYCGAFDQSGLSGFESTVDLAMPSCDGPGAHFRYRGDVAGGLAQPLDLADLTELALVDDFMGGSVTLRASVPVALRARPCYTVSQSEGGFEKVMQSVTLTLAWPLDSAHASIDLSLEIRKHSA